MTGGHSKQLQERVIIRGNIPSPLIITGIKQQKDKAVK